ncbi:MAG: PEP-utilizing enzyme, mobile region [Deltaproteobacteria bacterium]|nr:PEP-utilizing enzyme, mobile region [Deltaproteobacteria bacterium]
MTEGSGFPSPHEVPTIPGTEGWERMFPYYYRFSKEDPERRAYEESMFWFHDGLHYPEAVYPFDLIWDEAWYLALSQYNTRVFMVPPANGIDHRLINGRVYITPVPVKDPEEVGRRVGHFLERAGYYYRNWDDLYEQWEVKINRVIKELDELKIPALPEMEDLSVVRSGAGKSSAYDLLETYDKLISLGILAWQYHFEFLNLGYAAYVTLLNFCETAFPGIPIQRVTQMVSGIDVILYQPDEELKTLARLACDLRIEEELLRERPCEELMAWLKTSPDGRIWEQRFEAAKYPWFYISTGTGWFHHDPSWLDNLEVPLASIRLYIQKVKAGEGLRRPIGELKRERDRIVSEYRELLDDDSARETFDDLVATAQRVFPYVESHIFYVEHWFHSIFWNKMRDLSRRFVAAGFWDDVEDIWLLNRHEIKQALWDLVTAWATGTKPYGKLQWGPEIAWRKGVMEKFRDWTPPPAVGTPPEVITEPFTIALWGITGKSMAAWSKRRSLPEREGAALEGFSGSPGLVEGPVRVCRTVAEIAGLQDGEVLVCPTTSPSWATAFTKIKAAVTDVGGIMCHAAIVCREYGLPAVVGTGTATRVLKTGQRVRVDGTAGTVTLLGPAG